MNNCGISRWDDPNEINARLKALTSQPIWEVTDDYYNNVILKYFDEKCKASKAVYEEAGIIQIGLFTLLNELCKWSYWPCYLIALVASVVWNFTLNRKFTFKSANNVPKAMALVLCYYAVFTPLSTLLGNWLVETCGWNEYLVTVMNMLLNFVTEYLFDTFVVFRGSMDTNDLAKKEEQK